MRLITAYLYVTLRCNSRCTFCSLWRNQRTAGPDLPYELGIRLLNDLRRLGAKHVDFTGGEPTLYGPLPELIAHANRLGMGTSITSNGLLYPKRAHELAGLPLSLGFSLNGPSAEIHDKVQGVISFERAMESIQMAKRMHEPVHAHFTASDSTVHLLDDMLSLAKKLAVPLVIFPEFSYFGNKQLSHSSLEKLLQIAHNPEVCVNTASVVFQKNGGNDTHHPTCTAGKSSLAISPDGSIVLPCFHNKRYEIPTNGNLAGTYLSVEVQSLINQSGRFDFCNGCTNWCYINPSFAAKPSKYTLPYLLATEKRARTIHGPTWPLHFGKLLIRRARSPKPPDIST